MTVLVHYMYTMFQGKHLNKQKKNYAGNTYDSNELLVITFSSN